MKTKMSIKDIDDIESRVMKELPKFEGVNVNSFGQIAIPFNNEHKGNYKKVMNAIGNSGVKIILLGDDGKTYSPQQMNGRDYSEIRIGVNPIEMYGSGNGTYAKNIDRYKTIVESAISLSR